MADEMSVFAYECALFEGWVYVLCCVSCLSFFYRFTIVASHFRLKCDRILPCVIACIGALWDTGVIQVSTALTLSPTNLKVSFGTTFIFSIILSFRKQNIEYIKIMCKPIDMS